MGNSIALVVAAVAFAVLAVTSIFLWRAARHLFDAIAALYPEQAHLKRWPLFSRYGPLPPAQISYLQRREFEQLPDPALRTLGRQTLALVYVYAFSFMTLLLNLLWWSVAREA